MAKPKTSEPAAPPAYDPDARYEVRLRKSVAYRGRKLAPMHRHVMTGTALASIPEEAIADVQPLRGV